MTECTGRGGTWRGGVNGDADPQCPESTLLRHPAGGAKIVIFGHTNRAAKTHRGVHGQFLRLGADEPPIDVEVHRLLETGPDAVIPLEEAAAAIATADRFIRTIAELLG
jgi:hypothetical protein